MNKLEYEYKNVYKNLFIDKHKHLDVIEDCVNYLKFMKDLNPYMVEFEENKIIKTKVYLNNYIVEDQKWRPIIVITYDKYTFFANNSI